MRDLDTVIDRIETTKALIADTMAQRAALQVTTFSTKETIARSLEAIAASLALLDRIEREER